MSKTLEERKLYPRNATAKSHHWVTGNPVTTRPETGVDNSYPGLELDQRNLDKRFFPGLEFELHATGVLRTIDAEMHSVLLEALTADQLRKGVVLRALHGIFGEERDGTRKYTRTFNRFEELDQWRVIHDLEPGPLAIALAPLNDGPSDEEIFTAFASFVAGDNAEPQITHDDNGNLAYAFVAGSRAAYLDRHGVIDPAEYRPGDLTRSLCSPWQYDFALCGCFYWASNKPDIVQKNADSPQYSNFQRLRGDEEPPVRAISVRSEWEGSGAPTLDENLMTSHWETLPAVFDRVEGRATPVDDGVRLPSADLLSRQEVIDALRNLAPVEHGLMVEYLYAYYSIYQDAFDESTDEGKAVRAAAKTVLSVAIDEMRHMRWVNELLRELDEPPELGRFTTMPDIANDNRVLEHTFSLKRLSSDRLDWFIRVEAPSERLDIARQDDTVDGMYTRVLLSVLQGDNFSTEEKQSLVHLLKLIIDEGHDHYERFKQIRHRLSAVDTESYLQLPDNPEAHPIGHSAYVFEAAANTAYRQTINILQLVFAATDRQRTDAFIVAARELMYNIDDTAKLAIAHGGAPLFELPAIGAALDVAAAAAGEAAAPSTAAELIEAVFLPEMQDSLIPLRQSPEGEEVANRVEERLRKAQATFAEYD